MENQISAYLLLFSCGILISAFLYSRITFRIWKRKIIKKVHSERDIITVDTGRETCAILIKHLKLNNAMPEFLYYLAKAEERFHRLDAKDRFFGDKSFEIYRELQRTAERDRKIVPAEFVPAVLAISKMLNEVLIENFTRANSIEEEVWNSFASDGKFLRFLVVEYPHKFYGIRTASDFLRKLDDDVRNFFESKRESASIREEE